MYGNGKGDFTRHVKLPSANTNVTSRASRSPTSTAMVVPTS